MAPLLYLRRRLRQLVGVINVAGFCGHQEHLSRPGAAFVDENPFRDTVPCD